MYDYFMEGETFKPGDVDKVLEQRFPDVGYPTSKEILMKYMEKENISYNAWKRPLTVSRNSGNALLVGK